MLKGINPGNCFCGFLMIFFNFFFFKLYVGIFIHSKVSCFPGQTKKTDAERRRSENNVETPIIISAPLLRCPYNLGYLKFFFLCKLIKANKF